LSAAPKGEPAEDATVKAQKVPTEKTPNPPVQEPKPEILKKRIKIDAGFQSGMVSIKGFKKKTEQEATEKTEAEALLGKPKTAFTEEEFLLAWNNYIAQLKETGKSSFASTMEVGAPTIEGENVIVEIENTVQENELNTEKTALLGYLRSTLNNYSIQLKYNKVEVKEQTNYYTNRDRFNRLAELNPTLLAFKKRFNLETDY